MPAATAPVRALTLLCVTFLLAPAAAAQVVFDGTFGAAGPADTRMLDGRVDSLIDQDRGLRVEAGGRANLFHSFLQFDIPTNQSATFRAIDPVDAIIARVTGGSASLIEGALRSEVPGADLFLINPAGIFLTETSTLDLPGSFFATTADFIRFDDGTNFSSTADAPTVTAAPPSAFGFGPGIAADVVVEGDRFVVLEAGATFGASGGDVTIRNETEIFSAGGSIELAAVGGAEVEVPIGLAEWNPRADAVQDLGSVSIEDGARLQTLDLGDFDGDQGRVVLRGGQILIELSRVRAGGDGSDRAAIDLEATRSTHVIDASVKTVGFGNSDTSGIRISADEILVSGGTGGAVASETQGAGAGGHIVIETTRLVLEDNGRIQTDSFNAGPGGGISIDAGSIEASDLSEISSSTQADGLTDNDAGPILIKADTMLLRSGARIDGSTEGSGRGAAITLDIEESIDLSGAFGAFPSGVFARSGLGAGSDATGDGGLITIETGQLVVRDGAQISSSSRGAGNAGHIVILETGSVSVSGAAGAASGIYAAGVTGRGGDITISADTIDVSGEADIDSAALATGAAGSITLNANQITVTDGAQVSARATGLVDAGGISIKTGDLEVSSGARILTDSAVGSGGNISIDATGTVEVADSAQIATDVKGTSGQGGNVVIDSTSTVVNSSRVTANATSPDAAAGNIFVRVSGAYFESTDSIVEASNEFGVDGEKVIDGPINQVIGDLVPLSTGFLDASAQLHEACDATAPESGSFSIQRGRAPPAPPDMLLDATTPLPPVGAGGRCEHVK